MMSTRDVQQKQSVCLPVDFAVPGVLVTRRGIVRLTGFGGRAEPGPEWRDGKPPNLHYRHRFPAELISHAVWLYHVFSLSFPYVELLLAERGVIVSCESVRQW
jgi:hypothetical protein